MSDGIYSVDPQGKVKSVAKRWKEQYQGYPYEHKLAGGQTVGQIQQRLDNLPRNATPKHVEKIIGNKCWTHDFCSNCQDYFAKGVVFDRHGTETYMCLDCLEQAVRKARR